MRHDRFFFVFRIVLAAAVLAVLVYLPASLSAAGPTELSQEAASGPLADGASVQKLAGDFSFTEGPAADAAGNVYFTDQPNNRIMKWSVDGQLSVFLQPAGRANGLYFDRDGRLLACADEKDELWSIGLDKDVRVLLKQYDGKIFNGPNDLWVRPDGGLYFTDPFYKRPYWDHQTKPQDVEGVYYLTPDRKILTRVVSDLVQPNGIVGTADGKTLFVADIGAGKTYRYAIQADGSLTDRQLFCNLGSDGMTIDNEGNLYLTGQGVTIFNRQGDQIGHIPIDERWTANVCFGGADRHTLFITASRGLYAVRMRTSGVR
ncbi:MAG: SMP-30/gluconolactonase/LRE family protein [Acidobacteriota bacterium]